MAQEEHRNKSILQTFLEKVKWEDVYEEYYGNLSKEEKVILNGKNLEKYVYTEKYYNNVVKYNKQCGGLKF